ncbi:MFS monocarboxylate transporter [Microthyrium microscopicum]|uniref:MFS monocarboxylate transporter n=1 Tax=Microthyrium microscopicum TaxID=703497 RepID=A0A6A6TTM8_9PEZI|nr:MFS monocarboxylate transporter [Microthyrium microscopicum]
MSTEAFQSTIELQSNPGTPVEVPESAFSLPPVDHGKHAYLFLASCVMLEGICWGFPSVFGIFQDYYSSHEPFASSNNIAVIGTCAMGVQYLELPVIFAILKTWPRLRRWSNIGGLLIMCLSLGLGSFAKTVDQLIATQGVLFAIGGGFAWTPILFYINEWFVQKLAFAFGVIMAGFGLAGMILPLVVQWLLTNYGYQTTLRVCSVIIFILVAPFLFFFKPRLPDSQANHSRRLHLSFWLTPVFALSQLGNIIESLGYFLPPLYLPIYARSLGAGKFLSTLTIILLNGAAAVGNIVMGILAGRFHFTTCITISTIGTTLAVFLLWGLSESLPTLYIFCIMYGLFASCWASTWAGITRDVIKKKENADTGMIFASLAAGKGIGNVVSGPLSEALMNSGSWKNAAFAYGSGYGTLIAFTGITALFGGCSLVGRKAKWF